MIPNPFLLGEVLTAERLSWIAGSLKFYFMNLHPDSLRHRSKKENPSFIFFLTGDALYSLVDRELLLIWEFILSLPMVWIVCDREEMDLRGLSVDSLKMKYPDQIFDQNGREKSYPRSFWRDIIRVCRQHEPKAMTFGHLLLTSPYMNRPCQNALVCLYAATEEQMSPELYAYLDGIHATHINQKPSEFMNIGHGFSELNDICRKKNLNYKILACERCATARGYVIWDDGKGMHISNCTIDPCKIRNLSAIIERFAMNHPILGESAGLVDIRVPKSATDQWIRKERSPPPVVVLITRSPYSTEYTFGGLSFAIACAHRKIYTRVVFVEEGIYSLTGTHQTETDDVIFTMPDVIGTMSGDEYIEMYAYQPSFQRRGVNKSKDIKGVLDITINDLGQVLFYPPKGILARHQRILFF